MSTPNDEQNEQEQQQQQEEPSVVDNKDISDDEQEEDDTPLSTEMELEQLTKVFEEAFKYKEKGMWCVIHQLIHSFTHSDIKVMNTIKVKKINKQSNPIIQVQNYVNKF
jgi:hypothetical protein